MDGDIRTRYRRDYTKQPLRTSSSVQNTIPEIASDSLLDSQKNASQHPKRKLKGLLILLLVLIIAGGITAGGYLYYSKNNVVPSKIKSQAEIPVFNPTKLPSGFKINKNSFNVTQGNIITYYAENTSKDKINFTIQARPSNFNFDKFYSETMSNSTRFSTPLGEAAVGKAGGHLLGSLATTKSWALITGSNDNIDTDKIQTALMGMKITN